MFSDAILDRTDAWITQFQSHAVPLDRGGLGVTILLAGLHKSVAPARWHTYLAEPLAVAWPTEIIALDPTFVLFGVSEILFGIALLLGWHTPTIAAVTGLSLVAVLLNLALALWLGAPVGGVFVRDLGLTVFAFGVAVRAPTGQQSRISFA